MIRTNDEDNGRELPTVNRCAMVIEPTEVYLAWVKETPDAVDEMTLEDLTEESTVYLIPEIDVEPEAWLQRNYAVIFEDELWGWCTDETLFPEDRSFENFNRFFRVQFRSMVVDMGDGAIVRDAE